MAVSVHGTSPPFGATAHEHQYRLRKGGRAARECGRRDHARAPTGLGGSHRVRVDGRVLSSVLYIIRLDAAGEVHTDKAVLLK
jgi:hypothetical protein